ncbi:MAG TPA: c-type cytochrome [Vicinamibacteria bacterium]|nr:c-type cytochrome [Vicinamibacteria bacterium]
MKKILKGLGLAALAIVVIAAGAALYVHVRGVPRYDVERVDLKVDATPERVARGRRTVQSLCAGCHLNPTTGALTGKVMEDTPPQFGMSYSRNITQDRTHGIGGWTDGELAYLLRTGIARDGRYTPPWMVKLPHMSDDDLLDVIAFLRSDDPMVRPAAVPDRDSEPTFLTKLLTYVAFKPLPYPRQPVNAPPTTDRVAYGRYLVVGKLDCYGCHSADFAKMNIEEPEKSAGYLGGGNRMQDTAGKAVYTANITPHPDTGIGKWTEEQLARAVRGGIRPDNRPLRYPMQPYAELTDDEVSAIFAYLRSVPPLENRVPASEPYVLEANAGAGKQVYYKYACNTCHGDTGVGLYDLRKGLAAYPTDEALIAYIKHPERTKPGVKMPTWDGVIAEEEYPPLAAYVRSLGPKPAAAAGGPAATAPPGT